MATLAELADAINRVGVTVGGRTVVLRCLCAADQRELARLLPRPESDDALTWWVRTVQAAEVAVAMGHTPGQRPAWGMISGDGPRREWLENAAAEVLRLLPVEVVDRLHTQLRLRAAGVLSPPAAGAELANALRVLADRLAEGHAADYQHAEVLRPHAAAVHVLLRRHADRLEDEARAGRTTVGEAEKN